MSSLIHFLEMRLHVFFSKKESTRQLQSLFNQFFPLEIQLTIFEFFKPSELARVSLVCREWKILAEDPSIWKNHARQFGVKRLSLNPKEDYRYAFFYSKLNLKKILGDSIFTLIENLKIWGPISDVSLRQKKKDHKDYFGKTIFNNELVLIFIKARREDSKIIRISPLKPSSSSNEEKSCAFSNLECPCSIFYLSIEDTGRKESSDHPVSWKILRETLEQLFGLSTISPSNEKQLNHYPFEYLIYRHTYMAYQRMDKQY